jgi:hypothetical protein
MTYENPETNSDTQSNNTRQTTGAVSSAQNTGAQHVGDGSTDNGAPPKDAGEPATVIVRGETVGGSNAKGRPTNSPAKDKSPPKPISEAKAKIQGQLPALADDGDVGVQKSQVVVRDGKADLAFTGTLVASAAPTTAPKGKWDEYRIYTTDGGKHVFSKISRSIYAEDQDSHEAEIFDPNPDSTASQLLRSARDLTRSKPVEWTDAAVDFFGYDPLAKALYRKVSGKFEEHIS